MKYHCFEAYIIDDPNSKQLDQKEIHLDYQCNLVCNAQFRKNFNARNGNYFSKITTKSTSLKISLRPKFAIKMYFPCMYMPDRKDQSKCT